MKSPLDNGHYWMMLGLMCASISMSIFAVFLPPTLDLFGVSLGSRSLVFVYAALTAISLFTSGIFMGCYFLLATKSVSFLFGTWGMIGGLLFTIFAYTHAYFSIDAYFLSDCLISGGEKSRDILYFAVVTLTTLGYGDISPVGPCRFIAASEALLGVIFLPMIVAFFVGAVTRMESKP